MSKKIFVLAGILLASNLFAPSFGRAFTFNPKFETEPKQRQFLVSLVISPTRENPHVLGAVNVPDPSPRVSKVPVEIEKAAYDGKLIIRLKLKENLDRSAKNTQTPSIVLISTDETDEAAKLFTSIAYGESQEFLYDQPMAHALKVTDSIHSLYFFPLSTFIHATPEQVRNDVEQMIDNVVKMQAKVNSGDLEIFNQ